jgi:hypothetical protein
MTLTLDDKVILVLAIAYGIVGIYKYFKGEF